VYVTMYMASKPWSDERVRTAVKLASGRSEIFNAVFRQLGTADWDACVPEGDQYYPPQLVGRQQNIAQAKQLLAQAGYPNGLDVELLTSPVVGGMTDFAVVFKQTVAAAGINVTIKQWSPATYYSQVWLIKDFYVDYLFRRHPADYLNLLYTTNATWNETHIKDARVDQLTLAAYRELDPAKQRAALQQAVLYVAEHGGNMIPCFGNRIHTAVKTIQGVEMNATRGPLFHQAYLA
jgi:peptide/nickel transport system substrate-binding protein